MKPVQQNNATPPFLNFTDFFIKKFFYIYTMLFFFYFGEKSTLPYLATKSSSMSQMVNSTHSHGSFEEMAS